MQGNSCINNSRGHSFVQYEGVVYSILDNSLYYFEISKLLNLQLEWQSMFTKHNPARGLMNYGMEISSKGRLVIFGGVTEELSSCFTFNRNLNKHNELWVMDLRAIEKDFMLINWIDTDSGISKIISLGGELLCILNPYFDTQMVLINLDEMISYNIIVHGMPEKLNRTAFGIVGGQGNDFIVYGGFNEYGGIIKDINVLDILVQLSFSISTDMESQSANSPVILATSIGLLSILIFALLYKIFVVRKRKNTGHPTIQSGVNSVYINDPEKALQNAKDYFENRIKNIADNAEFTATLAIPNYSGLSVPAYKLAHYGADFRKKALIAKGGFGEVCHGELLNKEIIQNYSFGEMECVIKTALRPMNDNLFLQELSIHEVFKGIKYSRH